MVTNLIAEVSESYYELLALDNLLEIVNQNIDIQSNVLEIVNIEKQATRVTELAVKRFQAQLLGTKSLQYHIQQEIIETENHLNFLLGRYPQPIRRDASVFKDLRPDSVFVGLPAQLLEYRPDIKQAELEMAAAKIDIEVAKAAFYPAFGLKAGVGLNAYKGSLIFDHSSLLYYLGVDIMSPLINRNEIKAMYLNANARQVQTIYKYEQSLLNAYMEVANQVAMLSNMQNSYNLKFQQAQALIESVNISNTLFRSARADYMEVLFTQEEAQDSRFELVEAKLQQLHAWVNIYRALGGGWN